MVGLDVGALERDEHEMKITPFIDDASNRPFAFEIENSYISLSTVAALLARTEGVSEVRKRRLFTAWEHVHIWFKYKNIEFVVVEPYGDSSDYWIGPKSEKDRLDISELMLRFELHRPRFMRKIFGDILTLRALGAGK
jgi:hypothetical protein